jgi:hypothetical protein
MCVQPALSWICYKRDTSQELLGEISFKFRSIKSKFLILALNTFYRHDVGTVENRVLSIMTHTE